MAHPADGQSVPACVQHAVLDPAENRELAAQLPLRAPRSESANESSNDGVSVSLTA